MGKREASAASFRAIFVYQQYRSLIISIVSGVLLCAWNWVGDPIIREMILLRTTDTAMKQVR